MYTMVELLSIYFIHLTLDTIKVEIIIQDVHTIMNSSCLNYYSLILFVAYLGFSLKSLNKRSLFLFQIVPTLNSLKGHCIHYFPWLSVRIRKSIQYGRLIFLSRCFDNFKLINNHCKCFTCLLMHPNNVSRN